MSWRASSSLLKAFPFAFPLIFAFQRFRNGKERKTSFRKSVIADSNYFKEHRSVPTAKQKKILIALIFFLSAWIEMTEEQIKSRFAVN